MTENTRRLKSMKQLGYCVMHNKVPFFAVVAQQKNLRALQEAIRTKNMVEVKKIVAADPCVVNRQLLGSKRFPVLLALSYKNEEALAFLLTQKPNLLLVSAKGETVLSALPQVENYTLRQMTEKAFYAQLRRAQMQGKGRLSS